jgi:hypothetical protein
MPFRPWPTLLLAAVLAFPHAARANIIIDACEASVFAGSDAPPTAACGSFTLSAADGENSATQTTTIDASGGVVSTCEVTAVGFSSAESTVRVAGEATERFRFTATGLVTADSSGSISDARVEMEFRRNGTLIEGAFARSVNGGGGFSSRISRDVVLPAGEFQTEIRATTSRASTATWDLDLKLQLCNPEPLVPSFKQSDADWGSDTYDSSPNTISAKGCWLSSLAMGLNAVGLTDITVDGTSQDLDPGSLNDFMVDHPGSFAGFNVNPGPATHAASDGTLKFVAKRIDSTDDPAGAIRFLQEALCDGFPVVVGVKLNAAGVPGHFVLVTDINGDDLTDFKIEDPGSSTNDSLADYDDEYSTRGYVMPVGGPVAPNSGALLSPQADASDRSALYVATSRGTSLVVTDPNGRRTGLVGDAEQTQIFESVYFRDRLDDDGTGDEDTDVSDFVYVEHPAPGTFHFETTPLKDGPFDLTVHVVTRGGVMTPPTTFQGSGQIGVPQTFEVPVDPGVAATTTTTITGGASTTTTLPGCTALQGATFRSLACRLDALLAQVSASTDLGALQRKLRPQLERASTRTTQAQASCAEPNRKQAKKALVKLLKNVAQIGRILRSREARRAIPPAVREELLGAVSSMQADAKTLKGAVNCPEPAA